MGFNLSAWALQNRQMVLYVMILVAIVGAISYTKLGQSEDPPFTFKAMVVRTSWPGATTEEVSRQVTERIEKKLMETGEYERITSFSRPGESQIIFTAAQTYNSSKLPDLWYQVRKKVSDIRHTLPQGIQGPFFNDEFGTTFGNIYALTGKGFDYAMLKKNADRLQLQLQRVKDVSKVDLLGLQDEKIWIELSNTRLATLGLPILAVQQAIEAQNAVTAASFFETSSERVQLRVSGRFNKVSDIRNFPIRVGDRTFRIGDIADVHRGFTDPPAPRMRFMGEDAIGIAVSMKQGGDILRLGEALEHKFSLLQQTLPVGMTLHKVSDQPAAVKAGVGEFIQVLVEALIIVLLVSFFSLGLRTGLVVALSIPLVLAMTFAIMNYFGIGLHKISLGALVLALGLLVDDAIIAVEMMAVKIEQGYDRLRAASFAWSSTAFPMLTGTLITAAGFLPIATAQSDTGEYTRSIFQVVTIALLVSWLAAVVFVPYLGEKLIPVRTSGAHREDPHALYDTQLYRRLRRLIAWCVRRRKTVIALTIFAFVMSIALFRFVPQQFFPASGRLELMVDLKLTEGASLINTQRHVEKLERILDNIDGVDNYTAYVGSGAPRFYLPLDQQLAATSFAQFVVLTKSVEDRERIRQQLNETLPEALPFARVRVSRLENGPPVGYPIQFRVSGEHIPEIRQLAQEVAARVRENAHVSNVHLDWEEPSKNIYLRVDQDRARALGINTSDILRFLRGALNGTPVTQFREGNELIEIAVRGGVVERQALGQLPGLSIPSGDGSGISLSQIAIFEYGFEEGVIWHRNRLPTVTVRADILGNLQAATVVKQILPSLTPIQAALPDGYLLEVGGTVESSKRGQQSVNAGLPLFLVVVLTLLMLQLKSLSRSVLVLLTAPLGLIGVTLFLLVFRQPFGFVAMLGTIALSGMIMRNAVILVDQIEQDIAGGVERCHAIVEATLRRFRPIVLTSLAAILAMIPLSRSIFFGPMAIAIMGGLVVATVLTLLFLPALYAAWFRVRETNTLVAPRAQVAGEQAFLRSSPSSQ